MDLHESLMSKIQKCYDQLIQEGKILVSSQIDRYYQTFRDKFGLKALNRMDGEHLLETMHNTSNLDSLVYWLEFKNDEEFPTPKFGSIAGGSALKFGIYKKKETGNWMTGSPRSQKTLRIDEAVDFARKHRTELVKGCELLESLPADASSADYEKLQDQMLQAAPYVSEVTWGHKYFYLMYPDKLDDFHSSSYQRFHLIKLLQVPPDGSGRFVSAYYFKALAKELNLTIKDFTQVLSEINGRLHRYWRVGTKIHGEISIWKEMQAQGCVAIGWDKLGDLSNIQNISSGKEKIRESIASRYPDDLPQVVGRQTQQLFNFVAAFSEGDIVLPSDGMKVLGIGRITGDYFYENGSIAPHRRPVEWLSFDEYQMPDKEGLQTTVAEIKKTPNLLKVETCLLENPSTGLPGTAPRRPEEFAKLVMEGVPGRIQSVLERKRQVILYGPPGTGKTYWAQKTARALASHKLFGKSYEALDKSEQERVCGDKGLVRICTFHPAYGYEDFLEGFRPKTVNDQITFELQDGIMKAICQDAQVNPETPYYLIIDEINRGDIPRIFGELLTIMEKDKRGESILLSTSGANFQVPSNVFLIGTMNTADRSIALLDTALRRRFGFIELMPDIRTLGDTVIESVPLGPWLSALNAKICEHIGRDARNLQIGHSYFLENGKPITTYSKLMRILQDDILPLIEEYCYEDYATIVKILGKSLIDEQQQRVRNELFQTTKKDELIQALIGIDPSLSTSSQAISSEVEESEEEEVPNDSTAATGEDA